MTRYIPLFVFLFLVTSCTFTSTKKKKINFSVDNTTIENNLRTLVLSDEIKVNGIETTTNGQTSSELDIKIINGKNVPSNKEQLKALGKNIASQFKQEINNASDFNSFRVYFVTEKSNGNLTTSDYTFFTYKFPEL